MHLKRVLVDRLKDELLALGVVSLVVAFITSALAKVRTPGGGALTALRARCLGLWAARHTRTPRGGCARCAS